MVVRSDQTIADVKRQLHAALASVSCPSCLSVLKREENGGGGRGGGVAPFCPWLHGPCVDSGDQGCGAACV
jgi:hypothetical protein